MYNIKMTILKLSLFLIILLIILSIIGASFGAQNAQKLFNSLPSRIFWGIWLITLCSCFFLFPKMRKNISLLAIHFSILLILIGFILSSQISHKILQQTPISKFLSIPKVPQANMIIFEGQKENRIITMPNQKIFQLTFYVKLNDFKIKYYEPGQLIIITPEKSIYIIPAKINAKINITGYGTLKITRTFKNFKINFEQDNPIPIDSKQDGDNPAIEIQRIRPDKQQETYYIFSRYPEFSKAPKDLKLIYSKQIKDYISDVSIIKDDKIILTKKIRVNHPLSFGGYQFYQLSYDEKDEKYTILLVVSNLGARVIFAGYILLIVGIIWNFYGNTFTNTFTNAFKRR